MADPAVVSARCRATLSIVKRSWTQGQIRSHNDLILWPGSSPAPSWAPWQGQSRRSSSDRKPVSSDSSPPRPPMRCSMHPWLDVSARSASDDPVEPAKAIVVSPASGYVLCVLRHHSTHELGQNLRKRNEEAHVCRRRRHRRSVCSQSGRQRTCDQSSRVPWANQGDDGGLPKPEVAKSWPTKWCEASPGMTRDELRNIMGAPTEEYTAETTWEGVDPR